MRTIAMLLIVAALVGCGDTQTAVTEAKPLTVEEWKLLPAGERYTAASYERLKLGEPKFQNEQAWDKFYRTVVVPGQKKELAALKPRP